MFIKIVRLPVIRAISFNSLSDNSKREAHKQLLEFLSGNPLSNNPTYFQVFGRVNPMSMNHPGKKGYEFLLTIPFEFIVEGDIPVTFISPQLYAVVTSKGVIQMRENWDKLIDSIKESKEFTFNYPSDYDYDKMPSLELEHHIDPFNTNDDTMILDYYFPIKERE
jgi:hypothetical protein